MLKLLAAAVAVCAAAAPARAECGRVMFPGTPDGTAIPAHGSLYVYDARDADTPNALVQFHGRPGVAQVVRVAPSISRIDYVGFAGGELEVALPSVDGVDAHYPLTAGLPATPPPHVLQFWRDESEWTCSHSDELLVQIDQPVAAVRARWEFDGVTDEHLVVPRTSGDAPGASVVELGEMDCGGDVTLDMTQLHAGGYLTLTAIDFHGNETPITGLPDRLSEDGMPVDSRGMGHALAWRDAVLPAPAEPPVTEIHPLPGAATLSDLDAVLDHCVFAVAAVALLGWLALRLRGRAALRVPPE